MLTLTIGYFGAGMAHALYSVRVLNVLRRGKFMFKVVYALTGRVIYQGEDRKKVREYSLNDRFAWVYWNGKICDKRTLKPKEA
jgi:hypothetical protein